MGMDDARRAFLYAAAFVLAVEGMVVGASYVGADDVSCTSIVPVSVWYTFTSSHSESVNRADTSRTCYVNGDQVNCSSMSNWTNQYARTGGSE